MRFRYRHERTGRMILSLGGRTVRPRPIVGVTLIGPTGTVVADALLDSGSDETVFPEAAAKSVGIDLSSAPTFRASSVVLQALPLRLATATLRLTDGIEKREWTAWIGLAPGRMHLPILGFAGCLQYFTTTFEGEREAVELTVNGLYPGV
ncbi:MAG: hypothetical protein KY476_08355 [Planctomycetes bacterium]|nr:hypothetical protein [Planctomycetota bacterium]